MCFGKKKENAIRRWNDYCLQQDIIKERHMEKCSELLNDIVLLKKEKADYLTFRKALEEFDEACYVTQKLLMTINDKIVFGNLRYRYGDVASIVIAFERDQGFLTQECYIPNYNLLFGNFPLGNIDERHKEIRKQLQNVYDAFNNYEANNNIMDRNFIRMRLLELEKIAAEFDGIEKGQYASLIFRYDADELG